MWPVLAGLVGALVTAAITAYLGRRSKTGRIETSEAKDLWANLRGELDRAQVEAKDLRAEISVGRLEIVVVRDEAVKARIYLADIEAQLLICRRESVALKDRLKAWDPH